MSRRAIEGIVPVFRVTSVARSVAWYQEVLGFTGSAVGPPHDPVFAIIARDGFEVMLQKINPGVGPARSATQSGGGWDAYLRIHDSKATWDAVRQRIHDLRPIRSTEYGCQEFTVIDPDGHVLVLGEC